jgi:small multidrug resistance pump
VNQGADPHEGAARPPTRQRHMFEVAPGAHEALADLAATAGARIEEELHEKRLPKRRWSAYLFLALAIVAGVTGTSALSQSAGFTRPQPLVIVALAYPLCFVALTRALRVIPVSIAYAIWSGVGIALITIIGWVVFDQQLVAGELAGIALILIGTVVIQLFSRATSH